MVNIHLELFYLKNYFLSKGLDDQSADALVSDAEADIGEALRERLDNALDKAVSLGIQKDSSEFINDLVKIDDQFLISTSSGSTDFSDPPFPMLDRLLSNNAKPMKDGSGVYKVIPVGAPSKNPKKNIHTNIFDAQKALMAERHQKSSQDYNSIAPKNSKTNFRTATSKQNRDTQWVLPAKEKDFNQELNDINAELSESRDDIVLGIIKNYMEKY